MGLEIRRYDATQRTSWDALVRASRNGVFLFERDYLEYHADRFDDASLVVWRSGEPAALLPAHRMEGADGPLLVSHGGLTFGGLVLRSDLGAQDTLDIVDALLPALREQGWRALRVRPVPHIFHRLPSEDALHALLQHGARVVRTDLAHTVDLARRPPLASRRRRALGKAARAGVVVRPSTDWPAAWAVLEQVLRERHATAPVHRLDEIQALARRFDAIRLHGAYAGSDGGARLLAAVVTYAYDGVLHTQYLACSDEGREVGALDAVIASLLDDAPAGTRWLSFGASTHEEGRQLNAGLAAQKEMFGARPTILMTLELDLKETAR
ncbi:MAG: GNAT family N-acetyltransferase [Rubrivivax sp.]|nr:GNAT family N-acetyltransferase [Rubrivivax sp.]